MYKCFLKIGNTDRFTLWKSKALSDKIIGPTSTYDYSLAPVLSYTGNKTIVKLDGRWKLFKTR